MGVFEDVFSKARSAADYAGKKTGEVVEITRLRLSVSDAEGKLNKAFAELGEKVYGAAKDQSDCTDFIHEKSGEIDGLYAQIQELNEKIAALKKEKKCAGCGYSNPEEASFCLKCGAKL